MVVIESSFSSVYIRLQGALYSACTRLASGRADDRAYWLHRVR
jgi:hypothetical protein